jgi:hypothetical protein
MMKEEGGRMMRILLPSSLLLHPSSLPLGDEVMKVFRVR